MILVNNLFIISFVRVFVGFFWFLMSTCCYIHVHFNLVYIAENTLWKQMAGIGGYFLNNLARLASNSCSYSLVDFFLHFKSSASLKNIKNF